MLPERVCAAASPRTTSASLPRAMRHLLPFAGSLLLPASLAAQDPFRIPVLDLARDSARLVVVDREPGQYLGHVTTALLGDGRSMLAVYPKGHGEGGIVMKRSPDASRTWSERLPVPDNGRSSREVPTIHRVPDPVRGGHRLLLFSGLHAARLASSDDEGQTWTPLAPLADWGGIVVMGSVVVVHDGSLLAFLHDDGRYFAATGATSRRVARPRAPSRCIRCAHAMADAAGTPRAPSGAATRCSSASRAPCGRPTGARWRCCGVRTGGAPSRT